MTPTLITLTSAAYWRLQALLLEKNKLAIRLRLRSRGCSGLSYVMEYAQNSNEDDEVIALKDAWEDASSQDVKSHSENPPLWLFIQKKAILFLIGTQMDYQEDETKSGFIFYNPQEKGRCGCKASFHV